MRILDKLLRRQRYQFPDPWRDLAAGKHVCIAWDGVRTVWFYRGGFVKGIWLPPGHPFRDETRTLLVNLRREGDFLRPLGRAPMPENRGWGPNAPPLASLLAKGDIDGLLQELWDAGGGPEQSTRRRSNSRWLDAAGWGPNWIRRRHMISGRLVEQDGQWWIDTGTQYITNMNRFRVVAKARRFLAVRVPGHKYWGGIGQAQGYAPACFVVMICDGSSDDPYEPGSYWAERLKIPIRS